MSTQPGARTSPPASISRRPRSSTVPTARLHAPSTATSPRNDGAPVPSAIVAPRITTSCMVSPWVSACSPGKSAARRSRRPKPVRRGGGRSGGYAPAGERGRCRLGRLGGGLDDAERAGECFEARPGGDLFVLGEQDELRRARRVAEQLE